MDDHGEAAVPDDARACVVATRPETFARCREGVYPAPGSYDRTRADFELLACYRTAPVSAVTHYARVAGRREQRRGEAGPLSERDWERLVDPVAETDAVVVFELDELVPLAKPVENDGIAVRGAWYCTLGSLRAADTLSALADRTA